MSRKFIALGAGIIALTGFATYLSALKIQFYDGWWYLIWSATMDLPRFLIQFLDPANITQGYRPVQGMYMYLLYHLFNFNPDGYHYAHNLLHAANAVLLFLIIGRIGKNWRVAFVAGIIYVVLPNYSLAIFWHAVVDPLAGFFYLLTVFLWVRYLETQRLRDYVLTFVAYLLALFSKEIAIFIPFFLFLIARWFYGFKVDLRRDIRRYAPFLVVWVPYLYLVIQVQSHGEFSSQFGFKIGTHMLNNLIPYMAVLTFPWIDQFPTESIYFIWLTAAVIVIFGVMIFKRSTTLLFLVLFAVLNISPLLGFPLDYFNTRYLYLSTIASAVVMALLVEAGWQFFRRNRVYAVVATVAVACLILFSSTRVAEAAAGLAEYTRQIRVPFRDIAQQHPVFPPDSYVYLVYSPLTSYWDFEGLFFARYGQSVKVNATDLGHPADLRHHANTFVYYFDSTGKPIEVIVDQNETTRTTPTPPAFFQNALVLERVEVPNAQLERGKALVVILNWRAAAKLDKDYTFFAQLVDAKGEMISRYDSPPQNGRSRTSQWPVDQILVDAMVVPIPPDATAGENLRLQIGVYDSETTQRSPLVDATGKIVGDTMTVEPFRILSR